MSTTTKKAARAAKILAVAVTAVLGLGACAHMAMMMGGTGAERPAESEFGFGPRASETGLYRATLEPVEPLKLRKLQTVHLRVADAQGAPVDGAEIAVDGGMPEHGHGLPTKPRVRRSLGGGAYEVEGVRFNMGGWWEVTFAIAGPAGADRVTFNLDL